MIPAHWTTAVANHLWQSTVFAVVAALLALALRNNHARTRYWLWLIASVKFLIPFSALVALGSHLEWPAARPVIQPELTVVMQQITTPFPQTQSFAGAPAVPANPARFPLSLIWSCGFLAVCFSWWRQWRRIGVAVSAAIPLGLKTEVPVLVSPTLLEPGVFGIFRPVLLLPHGITDRLAPDHLQAIIAHELCHVRRRDNLAAAVHMVVEAIFWFHPLVWWLGARLVEERERACDEEVLRLGNQPEVYAESILKTCQFYLESPLTCMSGISGSDLKKRMVRIMSQHLAMKLSFGRKLLLAAAGVVAVAGPIALGLINAPQGRAQSQAASPAQRPSFEVASIKPNKSDDGRVMLMNRPGGRFSATGLTAKMLIAFAYNVKEDQISGASGWMDSEHFDIEAKAEAPAADAPKLNPQEQLEQRRSMLQSLLADRLKLTLRHETKELPVYMLVVAKNGPKLKESADPPGDAGPPTPPPPPGPPNGGPPPRGMIQMEGSGNLVVNGIEIRMFANVLSRQIGRIVIDKTGLEGKYDFTLKWTPDERQGQTFKGAGEGAPRDSPPPAEASGTSIFTALQEQLGLKLESRKAPVDLLVITHIEKPSAN